MSVAASPILKVRAERLLDERATVTRLHDDLIGHVESRDDKVMSDIEKEQVEGYRARAKELDTEIEAINEDMDRETKSLSASKEVRAQMAGRMEGVDVNGDQVTYQTFAAFARDSILARSHGPIAEQITSRAGGDDVRQKARERLARVPANTLLADVAGISPSQHINQIFQVIDSSRPIVQSATRASLERGVLTFPKIVGRPAVSLQATEKTEAGNTKMDIDMVTANASTYLGGGDLSWQAIEWSTPNALDLWFRLAASNYALATETDAAAVVLAAGDANVLSTVLTATPDYDEFVAAIVAGAAEVYANSGRMANTVYMSPDIFYLYAASQTATPAVFLGGSAALGTQGGAFGGLNVVVSRGMVAANAVVGDSSALICAETAGAPVQLRAVEPAIGGIEVGIIGAFEAVVAEDEAFASITTAV